MPQKTRGTKSPQLLNECTCAISAQNEKPAFCICEDRFPRVAAFTNSGQEDRINAIQVQEDVASNKRRGIQDDMIRIKYCDFHVLGHALSNGAVK